MRFYQTVVQPPVLYHIEGICEMNNKKRIEVIAYILALLLGMLICVVAPLAYTWFFNEYERRRVLMQIVGLLIMCLVGPVPILLYALITGKLGKKNRK